MSEPWERELRMEHRREMLNARERHKVTLTVHHEDGAVTVNPCYSDVPWTHETRVELRRTMARTLRVDESRVTVETF